jgi:hypothetical protein
VEQSAFGGKLKASCGNSQRGLTDLLRESALRRSDILPK